MKYGSFDAITDDNILVLVTFAPLSEFRQLAIKFFGSFPYFVVGKEVRSEIRIQDAHSAHLTDFLDGLTSKLTVVKEVGSFLFQGFLKSGLTSSLYMRFLAIFQRYIISYRFPLRD